MLKIEFEATRQKLQEIRGDVPRAAGNALTKFADTEILEMEAIVPVDTGELRDSNFVDPPEQDGNTIRVRLGFDTEYATAVHEDLEAFHPHGQAKYVSQPLNESRNYFPDRVGRDLKSELDM
jgi:hypothetical protein